MDFSGTNAFTITAWTNSATNIGWSTLSSRGNTNSSSSTYAIEFLRYGLDPSRWRAKISDGSSNLVALSAVDEVDLNQWQHMALTWDGTDLTIYKNGASIASSNSPGFMLWNPDVAVYRGTAIGADGRALNDNWNGKLDEVMVWNRALSAAEVAGLYDAGMCANPARINGRIVYNTNFDVLPIQCAAAMAGGRWDRCRAWAAAAARTRPDH